MSRLFLFLILSIFSISCSDYDEPLEASSDEPRKDLVSDVVGGLDEETIEKIEDVTEQLASGENLDEESIKEIISVSVDALDEVKESIETNNDLTTEEKNEALEKVDNIELEEFQNGLADYISSITNDTNVTDEPISEECLEADNMGLLPPPLPDPSCN